jgi:predicted XRE-type DNA-binding protein
MTEAKRKPRFPSGKRFEEIRERLSRPETMGSSVLPEGASTIDRAKFKACEMVIRYRAEKGMKQKELAERLGIDESRMSEILHYKVESFTLERLLGYAQALYPNLKLEIVAA